MDIVLYKKIISEVKPNARSESYFKRNHPEIYNHIISTYPGVQFKEGIYLLMNDLKEPSKCYCGKPVGFRNSIYGYNECCSQKCASENPTRVEKILTTKLEKYGDKKYNNREKAKETTIQKYDVENVYQNEEIKRKIRETNLKKYGVEYPSQSPQIQETQCRNNLLKYGVKRVQTLDVVKNKILKRNQENYIKNHPIIKGYTNDGDWVCKCPHNDCGNCEEKQYIIHPKQFFARKEFNLEPCTNLLPISAVKNKDTWPEKFIKNILSDYNIIFRENVRDIIYPLELDIYIPDKKIAVECNGCYWHSDDVKEKNYHLNKYNECLKQGIQLITVWEDQIINTPDIVKSVILSKLGIYNERIYARKCNIKEIPPNICSSFLSTNHLQGKTKTKVRLGLFYGEKLVGVMTFNVRSKLSGGSTSGHELNRFCALLGMQVIGGAEKLLHYFVCNYHPDKIISFSSNDISTGNLYKKLGFTQGPSTTSYWYVHKKTYIRYHRTTFQKSNIVKYALNNNETEKDIMSRLPYYRIYDSGHTRWEYKQKGGM